MCGNTPYDAAFCFLIFFAVGFMAAALPPFEAGGRSWLS